MKTATAADWQYKPFTQGESVPYRASFGADEMASIARGLVPARMEEKWFIFFDEPYLFLHRAWTGKPYYRVKFEAVGDVVEVTEALVAQSLTSDETAQVHAQLLAFLIDNLLLGRSTPFPVAAAVGESLPGIAQHVFSGTGYPQK